MCCTTHEKERQPCIATHRKAHVTIAGQASRILDQGGFAPDGTDLTALLSAHSDKNRTALETWIGETIVREGLVWITHFR